MRVLMFGRGTIATIYGRELHRAGHDVEFYVRPGRVTEYGDAVQVDLIDARRGPFRQRVRETFRTTLIQTLAPEDGFDLIVLSVGHHRLAEAAAFLAPRIGDATVVVLGNIWEEPIAAVAPLPADQVVFGFPLAGGGFADDGVLHGGLFGNIIIGTTSPSPTPREVRVLAVFRHAGLKVREEKDMRGWLFVHFVSDAGMFTQALQSGSLAQMAGDHRALRDAFRTSRELLPLLTARGVDLSKHRGGMLPYRFPRLVGAMSALVTATLPIGKVSLEAHTDPRAAEPLAVLHDTLREARRLGIPAPRLERQLAALDADEPAQQAPES